MKYLFLSVFWPCLLGGAGALCQVTGEEMAGIHLLPDSAHTVLLKKIIIAGNKVTRRSVILREINLREGEVIPKDSIEELITQTKLRLFNVQLFNEVTQDVASDSTGAITWTIAVKERWYIIPTATVLFADRNINTWWVKENHDLRRVSGGITLTDKNFRGNLETLAVTVQDGYTQKLGLAYMRPYLNADQVHGIGFSVSAAQSRQTYYATDSDKLLYAGGYSGPVIFTQLEGGISYIYRPAYASRHVVRLSYKDYEVGDTVRKLNPDFFQGNSSSAKFMELLYRYEYNGADNWNYPLRGVKLVTAGVLRNGFTGIGFQSYGHVEAGYFSSFAPGWYWAGILRGRIMWPQQQPYYFRGGLGTQTDYVRGYEYYVIDGDDYGLLRLDLKRQLFNNTYSLPVEYFTAIPIRIYAKLFADAGYINNIAPGNSFLNNRALYSAGAGVDIVTLYDIKIRLEYACNSLGQWGFYVHFNSE